MFDKLKEQLLGINDAIADYERRIQQYESIIEEQKTEINRLTSALKISNDKNKEYQKQLEDEKREHEEIVAALNARITELETNVGVLYAVNDPVEEDDVSDLMTDGGFYLSNEQADAYYRLNDCIDNDNYFITGKAGTGKSAVLNYFRNHTDKRIAVVAPTGIAAINVKGQTIHSFFGLKATVQDVENTVEVYRMRAEKMATLKNVDAIVIDEISMVRADVMDMIDAKLRYARRNNKPFGGCQIIAFGDLYQLPPVVTDDEHVVNFLNDRYDTEFFFSAPAVKNYPFKRIELQKVHRQSNPTFINTLNNIRLGVDIENSIDVINSRCVPIDTDKNFITITPTRSAAEMINNTRLNILEGREYTYYGDIIGEFKVEEAPTDLVLMLKEGAQVMMIKNDQSKRWVNGTLGVISKLTEEDIRVKIDGREYYVDKEDWEKIEYYYDTDTKELKQKVIGTFKQYPLKLSYAITIHKSQGQTFNEVCIDYSCGGAFAAGQTYVAISRCKSLEGLYLTTPISIADIKVDDKILNYMKAEEEEEVPELIKALGTDILKNLPIIEPVKEEPQVVVLQPQIEHPQIEQPQIQKQQRSSSAPYTKNIITITPPMKPKKITGSNFGSLFGADKFNSEFATWCKATRTYEAPFDENKYTAAGNAIEPIQIKYIKNHYKENIVSPEEHFGPDPKRKMNYDFFPDNKIFGGMWDSVKKEGSKIVGVYEMKTAKMKKWSEWSKEIPKNYLLQVALYAQLLHVDDMTIVASFLDEKDYDHPENFKCTEENTRVFKMKLSKVFPNFSRDYMEPAMRWWEQHVLTGISPEWTDRDVDIVEEINNRNK